MRSQGEFQARKNPKEKNCKTVTYLNFKALIIPIDTSTIPTVEERY
jgi:hypothetical protein